MNVPHTRLALSVRQPWADQILTGAKTEEYRTVPVKLRGRIYIYASLGYQEPEAESMPRGVVIGEVTIHGCREDRNFGYAWLLKDPVRWDTPRAPAQRANPLFSRPWGETPDAGADAAADATRLHGNGDGTGTPPSPPVITPERREWEDSDAVCRVRQYFATHGAVERRLAIAALARELGYHRAGSTISAQIDNTLRTAIRRGVLQQIDGVLMLNGRGLDALDRGHLKTQFCASIGRRWVEREETTRTFARWMGFRRVGAAIDESCRSLIRGLLREGSLEADGSRVRRA